MEMETECGVGLLGGASFGPSGPLMQSEPESGRKCLERLALDNLGWLRGWLRGRVQDPQAIDDLCQESFLRAFRQLHRLRDPSRFPSWLYRIALNVLRDHIRSEARRAARMTYTGEIETLETVSSADAPQRKEEAEMLLQAIRELPARLREPLLLRHSRGLSYREIGAILGIRENAVQVRIFRARRRLRRRLQGSLDETPAPPEEKGSKHEMH